MQSKLTSVFDSAPLTDSTAIEIVREYAECQQIEKDVERRKKELAKRMNMLIPADLDAKAFVLPERAGGKFIARRVRQDRRKPDDSLLLTLLDLVHAPADAYIKKPNLVYVASMLERGDITLEQFGGTMTGQQLEYVSLKWKANGANDDD